jgi:hypothetical protein
MRSMLVRLEHMCYVGIDFLIVTVSCAFAYIYGIVVSKRPNTTLHVSRKIGSTTNIRLVPYMWLCRVSVSLTIVDTVIAMEGP